MKNQYSSFAYFYDVLMEDVDYHIWVDYLEEIFEKYEKKPKLLLDLACGTGSTSIEFTRRKYDTIGIDISLDMLNVAKEKSNKENLDILFLNQDMKNFELYGTVDAVVCLMDSLNYITNEKDILKIFGLVHNYLNPGGLFVFDINTEYKLKEIIGENTFVYDMEEVFCVWESFFDQKTKICDFYLTFFGKEDNLYRRFDETHKEKAYKPEEIKKLLNKVNFKLLNIFNEFTFNSPKEKSERIFFVVEKN